MSNSLIIDIIQCNVQISKFLYIIKTYVNEDENKISALLYCIMFECIRKLNKTLHIHFILTEL